MGNITHKLNTSNTLVDEYGYDAWGRRRNPTNWNYDLTSQPELFADRGFTGHEHLKWFNLVNMNGRLYDPLVGRFLSVDPYVQDATNSQNLNRYSYCLNNPLKFTDPSGYRMAAADEYRDLGAQHFEMRIGNRDAYGNRADNGGADGGADLYSAYKEAERQGYAGTASDFVHKYQNQITSPNNDGTAILSYYTSSSYQDNGVVVVVATRHKITIGNKSQGGGDYLSTTNNWLNGAGYLSGGIGTIQIGMLEYRSSLPLMSKIGTFSRFSSTYGFLGTTSRLLGRTSNWIGAPISLGLDIRSLNNRDIGVGRFAYRQLGLATSIGGGAAIGWAFGGPYGAAGGAIIGSGFVAGEYIYDGVTNIWDETLRQINNFDNAVKSGGWYPGR